MLVGGRAVRAQQRELLEQTGYLSEHELRLRRPDGQVRTVIDSCYRVRDSDSGEMLHHGVLVDITERKLFEQQLKEMTGRDALTGCFNRRYLAELEPRLVAKASTGAPSSSTSTTSSATTTSRATRPATKRCSASPTS